jgi:hypothetical protein
MDKFKVVHIPTGDYVSIASCYSIEEIREYLINDNVHIIKEYNKFLGIERLIFSHNPYKGDSIPKYQFEIIEDV